MTTTTTSAREPAAPSASFLARRPVWQVSYLAGLAASVAVETWGLAARAAGVPMRAAGLGSHHASPVTVGMFAMGTMVVTFWFTFAVILIARFSKNPRRTYLRTALPLLVLSLVVPLTAADTATSTKLTLAAAHLIAGAVIIPVVARRLSRPR
jgi:heme A synthase